MPVFFGGRMIEDEELKLHASMEETRDGFILPCVAYPLSDLVMEVSETVAQPLSSSACERPFSHRI